MLGARAGVCVCRVGVSVRERECMGVYGTKVEWMVVPDDGRWVGMAAKPVKKCRGNAR